MKYQNQKCKRLLSRNYKKIIISEQFKNSPPKSKKLIAKRTKFLNGQKLSPIFVDENMVLIDGYCTYLLVNYLNISKRRFKIYQVKRDKANGQTNIQKNVDRN
ncbi:MAG: hypothetical protein NC122_07395 [Faecalibacterium sp.]|nr:hypothetical protein [Ruminococcus sp.]MCM1392180.1 hypothetical protein [Ruminococcus sp.]MCM1486016.1 hypothetical protein [Faecalibacterium sp.]